MEQPGSSQGAAGAQPDNNQEHRFFVISFPVLFSGLGYALFRARDFHFHLYGDSSGPSRIVVSSVCVLFHFELLLNFVGPIFEFRAFSVTGGFGPRTFQIESPWNKLCAHCFIYARHRNL